MGGWPTPSHRLKASAQSLSWPGIWETSTSIQELEMRRLSFSRSIDVEKSLLEVASAMVLSDKVGILMGILEPGKNWMVIYSAICARVSRLVMSFCKLSWIEMLSDLKSLWVMGRLNQEHWPEGKTIAPPIPLWSPDANASATHNHVDCCLGHIVRTGGRLFKPCNMHRNDPWGWSG